MHVSELKESKFLRKEDVGAGVLYTIAGVSQQNVAKEGAPEELRWVMHFDEVEKPLVLNSTNGQIIAKFTGSEDSEGWLGQQVVLYHDPNVSFGGKLVGGIRCRAPRKPGVPVTGKRPVAAPVAKPTNEAQPAADDIGPDGLPF